MHDAIVIGLGGVGSAAIYHLAKRGAAVLGIEQFKLVHDRGSSHGHTRAIRQSYFEHPDYVPLLKRAYQLWNELSAEAGQTLYHQTGIVQIGPPEGEVVRGVLASAEQHELNVAQMACDEARHRWPGLRVPEGQVALFEEEAGYLLVEDCVRQQIDLARRAGAEVVAEAEVTSWTANGGGVEVTARSGTHKAKKLVITAGAWAGGVLRDLAIPLEIRRKLLFWFRCDDDTYRPERGFPVFLYDLPNGIFYGFPKLDDRGVKVAQHSGGLPISEPSVLDREPHADDRQPVERFVGDHVANVSLDCTDSSACMYTMTRDSSPYPLPNGARGLGEVVAAGRFTAIGSW